MPLRCPDSTCDGVLKDVKDSRDGGYQGAATRGVFSKVRAFMGMDCFWWRLRECTVCKQRWSTVEEILGPEFGSERPKWLKKQTTNRPANSDDLNPMLTHGEASGAVAGFTGDTCIHCQSLNMVRSGTCQTCQDCGETTGCS